MPTERGVERLGWWCSRWTARFFDPHSLDRNQYRERLGVVHFGAVVLLLRQYRHKGSAALYHGVIRAEVTSKADSGNANNDSSAADLGILRRGDGDDGRRSIYHAESPIGAPTSFIKGTGLIAPARLRSPLRWTSKCRCGPEECPEEPT